ncbi:MAG: toll/interleukin-1 receptor domain-containing protein [Verrucomicrobiota bacterium]
MSRTIPVPEVYIIWHPKCDVAGRLAPDIYNWLRPGNGLGPQVFYRSLKAPDGAESLPVPIPGEGRGNGGYPSLRRGANVQILILLIDCHLIADPAWRMWLQNISRYHSGFRRIFIPVALDPTAYNIPAPIRDLNFLRPTGLERVGEMRGGYAFQSALAPVSRSLLKQLTETLCRFMIGGTVDDSTMTKLSADEGMNPGQKKLKVFLSHAKADGTSPARRIRDYIYSQTQLAAFFDENDIAYASAFAKVLEQDLNADETAAFIAVRSSRYASRPWCRRELATFRRPRPEASNRTERWKLYPTLVVDSMDSREHTPGIPEFGNSTLLRWDEGGSEQEEQIVTTVLRDVMLSAFHSALGASMAPPSDHIVINWAPDPTSLLQIPRIRDVKEELHVVYPGRGMSYLELGILSEFFPRITFHSFEEYNS